MARDGRSPPASPTPGEDLEAEWQRVKSYPMLMLIGLIALGAAPLCLIAGNDIVGYAGVALFGVGLFTAVIWVNRRHRAAFIAREMSHGSSESDALELYRQRYSD